MKKTCIIIAGPTASGKTSVALDIARHYSTEIISSDSRQCYKELEIGVAKPTAEQLQEIPHHFINSHSIYDVVSAASFEEYALSAVHKIFLKNEKAVMVGGTGLYIKAFCEGLDIIPVVDETIRSSILQSFRLQGIEWLQNEI
ncbi:MAG: isopentenyl transferase family protein, partial [Ferruginibacter sp.]